MRLQRTNIAWLTIFTLVAFFLLSSCKIDMEVTLNSNGGGEISTTFTTDQELLYQQFKAEAEKEREKGIVIETGAQGPNRFVRLKGRFARIEELNGTNSDFIWTLHKDQDRQFRLNIRANTKAFPAPLPLTITVHMPGKIIEAPAGVNINGRTARWEGMYVGLAGQGLSIRSEVGRFGFPAGIVVVLLIGGAAAVAAYLFMRRAVPARAHSPRFCEECGKAIPPRSRFCSDCGARISN